ncbi:unnamed protein product, partial [Scytosiphon promiscuus]
MGPDPPAGQPGRRRLRIDVTRGGATASRPRATVSAASTPAAATAATAASAASAASAAAAGGGGASKKRPSRAATSFRRLPRATPSRSIHTLLMERQRRPCKFVTREGAGVWSPDPLQRAFASDPRTLRRLQLSGELRGHAGCVNTVSCTPDGKYWITGSDDTMLMVWDCESHERKRRFPSGHVNNVFQARALPYTDNEKIVSCAADGQVRLTYLSRTTNKLLGLHDGRAHRLAIEPGSPNRFMTCGEDGVVLTFDLRVSLASNSSEAQGVPLLRQPGSKGISGMALNPADPNYLFVCGDSPYLDCYDARKVDAPAARYCPRSLRGSASAHITGVAVNWCGSEVVATYNPAGEVYRFDVNKNAVGASSDDSLRWRGGGRSVRQRRMAADDGGSAAAQAAAERPPPAPPFDRPRGERSQSSRSTIREGGAGGGSAAGEGEEETKNEERREEEKAELREKEDSSDDE